MNGKKLAMLLAGFLVVGLVVGGVLTDFWWRQGNKRLEREVVDLQARFGSAESKIKELTTELNAERDRRQRLEELLSKGRK